MINFTCKIRWTATWPIETRTTIKTTCRDRTFSIEDGSNDLLLARIARSPTLQTDLLPLRIAIKMSLRTAIWSDALYGTISTVKWRWTYLFLFTELTNITERKQEKFELRITFFSVIDKFKLPLRTMAFEIECSWHCIINRMAWTSI